MVHRPGKLRHQPVKTRARLHGLPQHQPRIIRVSREKIEVTAHAREKLFTRRCLLLEPGENGGAQLPKQVLEYSAMQAALVAEIVVEHGLVRVCRHGNFFGASPCEPLRGKMLFRCRQNSSRCRRVSYSSSSARHVSFRPPACSCIPRDTARPRLLHEEKPDRDASDQLASA